LLEDTDKLRYVPANKSDDSNASITYRAWDRMSGTAGNKIDSSSNGGITEFSTEIETATINVITYGDPYMDVDFAEGVYGASDGSTPVSVSDFTAELTNASGTTAVSVDRITKSDGTSTLTGGETTIRVYLSVTGTPDGTENIAVKPLDGTSIYDEVGNVMSNTQTTGAKTTTAK